MNTTSNTTTTTITTMKTLMMNTGNKSKVGAYLRTFSEFLQAEEGKICIGKGDYYLHITNWLNFIRRDQVLYVCVYAYVCLCMYVLYVCMYVFIFFLMKLTRL